jgi:hypothetical protein
MYAYGNVIIERSNVRALPASALVHSGEQTFYWRYENGHAVRTEVQTGISDGEWVEVTSRQAPPKSPGEDSWTPIDGTEQVIVGDLAVLSEGGSVKVADSSAKPNVELARAAASGPAMPANNKQ